MPPEPSDRTVPTPAAPAEPARNNNVHSSPPNDGHSCSLLSGRILIAEDNAENQRLLSHLLRRAGATVEVAENGAAAFDAIVAADRAHIPFDLLVTDRDMPRMDGPALAAAIRARGLEIPIIALTANQSPENPMILFASGCDDYATKPIAEQDLLTMCAHWLEQRKTRHSHIGPLHHAA